MLDKPHFIGLSRSLSAASIDSFDGVERPLPLQGQLNLTSGKTFKVTHPAKGAKVTPEGGLFAAHQSLLNFPKAVGRGQLPSLIRTEFTLTPKQAKVIKKIEGLILKAEKPKSLDQLEKILKKVVSLTENLPRHHAATLLEEAHSSAVFIGVKHIGSKSPTAVAERNRESNAPRFVKAMRSYSASRLVQSAAQSGALDRFKTTLKEINKISEVERNKEMCLFDADTKLDEVVGLLFYQRAFKQIIAGTTSGTPVEIDFAQKDQNEFSLAALLKRERAITLNPDLATDQEGIAQFISKGEFPLREGDYTYIQMSKDGKVVSYRVEVVLDPLTDLEKIAFIPLGKDEELVSRIKKF